MHFNYIFAPLLYILSIIKFNQTANKKIKKKNCQTLNLKLKLYKAGSVKRSQNRILQLNL